jgi:hypothetical protein
MNAITKFRVERAAKRVVQHGRARDAINLALVDESAHPAWFDYLVQEQQRLTAAMERDIAFILERKS